MSHPENTCADCGRPNAKPWFTSNELWNAVMRGDGQPEPIICPVCFISRAETAGFHPTAWELRPESAAPLDVSAPLVAQQDEEEIRRWIYGVENGAPMPAGDFLRTIVAAALRADYENYPLMRPLIVALKQKFPKYKFEGTLPQDKL